MSTTTVKEQKKAHARDMFVAGFKISKIAKILTIGERTVQNYQSEDKKNGIDWLELKAQKYINTPLDSNEDRETLYSNFTKFMYESLQEIRDDEKLDAKSKTALMAQLGDSFSKMQKVARTEDPEAYKLGIIQNTVEIISNDLEKGLPQESFEIVANILINSIEKINSATI